jgi:hypothetical protein
MVNGNDIVEFEERYCDDLMRKYIADDDDRNKDYWSFVEREFSEYNAGVV